MNADIAAVLAGESQWCVVQGDCREVMAEMPGESVGLIITSPPYNIGIDYGNGKDADKLPPAQFWAIQREWLAAAFRVAGDGCRMYVAVSEKMLWDFKPLAEGLGWVYSQLFTWCKTNFVGGTKRITGEWNMMTDTFLVFRKGQKTPMIRRDETNTVNWFRHATPQSNFNGDLRKMHPAQWPIPLIDRFIAHTPGELVFDPFCGSGSVGVSAFRRGRKFIGCDISDAYCESAHKRIDAAARQGRLDL